MMGSNIYRKITSHAIFCDDNVEATEKFPVPTYGTYDKDNVSKHLKDNPKNQALFSIPRFTIAIIF